MSRYISVLVTLVLFISFALVYNNADASKGKKVKAKDLIQEFKSAKDCQFLYILQNESIDKHSLPDLALVTSVDLPRDTEGEAIDIAGQCGDPKETVLVVAKGRKGKGGSDFLLSYTTDLVLVSELEILSDDDDSSSDDDDSESED